MLNTHTSKILLSILLFGVFLFSPLSARFTLANEANLSFSLPSKGYVSTYFSNFHPGVDIATDLGTKIHPIASGIVEDIFYNKTDYGTHIIVSHGQGTKSLYAHLGNVLVKKGQVIDTSTDLATVGLTGHTSGPHTHLEITKDGVYLDPAVVMPDLKALPVLIAPAPVVKSKEESLVKSLKPDFSGV